MTKMLECVWSIFFQRIFFQHTPRIWAFKTYIERKITKAHSSVESKRLRRKVYRNKKKLMKHNKYYNELCEKGLKERYRKIPINDRLAIGTLESEDAEEDS